MHRNTPSKVAGINDGLGGGNHLANRPHRARSKERPAQAPKDHGRERQDEEYFPKWLQNQFTTVRAAADLQNGAVRKSCAGQREIALRVFWDSQIGNLTGNSEDKSWWLEFDPILRRRQQKDPVIAVNQADEERAGLLRLATAVNIASQPGCPQALINGAVFLEPRFEHLTVFALNGIRKEQVSAPKKDK